MLDKDAFSATPTTRVLIIATMQAYPDRVFDADDLCAICAPLEHRLYSVQTTLYGLVKQGAVAKVGREFQITEVGKTAAYLHVDTTTPWFDSVRDQVLQTLREHADLCFDANDMHELHPDVKPEWVEMALRDLRARDLLDEPAPGDFVIRGGLPG